MKLIMKLMLASLGSFAIVVTVIILLSNGSDFATQLAVGITLLLVTLWGWVLQDKIKKMGSNTQADTIEHKTVVQETKKESMLNSDEPKQIPNSTSDDSASLLQQIQSKKDVKESIHLPNQDEPEKLSLNNTTINTSYKKARQIALSVYADCRLSHFSIQVYPFDCAETENSIVKSRVNTYFDFFAENAKKVCKIRYNESYGIERLTPDDDAHWLYSHPYPNLPWVGVQWKAFIAKAFERVKPLTVNKKTYYIVIVYSNEKNLPWVICFYDGYNGRSQTGRWNGKGSNEKDITILWDN